MPSHEVWDTDRWHRERGTVPHKRQDHSPDAGKKVGRVAKIELPYPPSVNHYWRRVGARTLISRGGRAYTIRVSEEAIKCGWTKMEGRLSVSIFVSPPDKRRRDLDNVLKSLLDACTKAGMWDDDSQIDRLIINREDASPPLGGVSLVVEETA